MKNAYFRFDENLRNLLPGEKRVDEFDYAFNGPQSTKHLIESMGIPHTEIGIIRANGHAVTPGYQVADGDVIEVFVATPEDINRTEPRFVLDGHLGRLAAYLRMLGLDCLYSDESPDESLIQISLDEDRELLTRDRHMLMHKSITKGYLVRSQDPKEQSREVIYRYNLAPWIRAFQRCIRCNHIIEPVEKEQILERLEPLTRLYFDEFSICPACHQIYWKGSHFDKMVKLIADLEK